MSGVRGGPVAAEWYYFDARGARWGPFTADEVRQLVRERVIARHTTMAREGQAGHFLASRLQVEFPDGLPSRMATRATADAGQNDRVDAVPLLACLIGRPDPDIRQCLRLIHDQRAYGVAEIPKPRGGVRTLHPPHDVLKVVQRAILDRILHQVPVHLVAHGFCRNRDILTNARAHARARTIFNLDLKDAFPSVPPWRVRAALARHVRRLLRAQFGREGTPANARAILELLVTLTTHDGGLPQGAPTSPAILNIVCINLDRQLFGLCAPHGFTVTRYADDITISTERNEIPGPVRDQIRSTIATAGWKVNERKVSYARRSRGNALEVTGLLIHEDGRLSITPERRKAYRQYLVGQLATQTMDASERAKAEGVIAFIRRIYQTAIPSILRSPIERLEKALDDQPRPRGTPRARSRPDLYGPPA